MKKLNIILFALGFLSFIKLDAQVDLDIEGKLTIGSLEEAVGGTDLLVVDGEGVVSVKESSTLFEAEIIQDLPLHGNYQNYGFEYQNSSYTKKEGRVYLGGLIEITPGIVNNGDTIAVLPIGYRPQNRILTRGKNLGSPRVDVLSDGVVKVMSGVDGSSNYLSLDGIEFKYEAPEIGDLAYGGIVFYVADPPQDLNGDGILDSGLVAAPADLPGNWAWGCENISGTGTFSGLIGAGYENTKDIIEGCSEINTAGRETWNYSINNYDDWFFPSQNELLEMRSKIGTIANGFQNQLYWSSTTISFDSTLAICTGFISGINNLLGKEKSNAYKVRPIRVF